MKLPEKYNAARQALAVCVRVDEVKSIRDKAVAMQVYAQQAKDTQLIDHATDIRLRAERRAGEMLKGVEKNQGARAGGKKKGPRGSFVEPRDKTPRLSDLGISKKQSHKWQKLAGMNKQDFEEKVATTKRKAVKALDGSTTKEKQERRAAREKELGAKQTALPKQKYGVILADPEWRFEPRSRETGMDRAADNHYPTNPTDIIAARPVKKLAAPDCVLFLWATAPMLPDALQVMKAWGFEYRSNYVWYKEKAGTGYWNRNAHEHLLVGVRGSVPAPAPGKQLSSVIRSRPTSHSAKPEAVLRMIEAYFPTLPKIELNRRGPARKGWSAWGNEVEE